MKRSYKIILISIGLIVTGYGMDEIYEYVPFSTDPQVNEKIIEGNSMYLFQINSKGTTKISGLFLSTPQNIPITIEILNPDGSVLWKDKSKLISGSDDIQIQVVIPSFFNSNSNGKLDVIITNLGNERVVVNGGIHDEADILQYESDLEAVVDVYFETVVYTIISSSLKFVGIIVGIIGVIIFFIDWKKSKISKIS